MTVFSFFLALSLLMWLLNALNKNYTTEIKYPISYSKFPQGKVLVNDLPKSLILKVNAHGYALLSYKIINRPVPISFSVNAYTMNRYPGDASSFYLLTNYAREQVSRQLSSELQLVDITPDTLKFKFAELVEKRVPVFLDLAYDISKQFTYADEISISPDTILVSGPNTVVDTMQNIYTQHVNLGILEKSYSGALSLKHYPGVKMEAQRVNCVINIEKLTEIQLQVPIRVTNLPDSLRMQTFPQHIRVSGRVGLSNYDRIVPEAFLAEIDYSKVDLENSKLQVNLKTVPDGLESVDFYPQNVEYLLSVK
jgi:hypothetical protein